MLNSTLISRRAAARARACGADRSGSMLRAYPHSAARAAGSGGEVLIDYPGNARAKSKAHAR